MKRLIDVDELLQHLQIAQPYNNPDVPQYVWEIIKRTRIVMTIEEENTND